MAKEYILKDRHGNERTFDKETFYVRGTDGELIPFTHGTGKGIVEPLSVTENGTFTPPEGVDGYSPVTVAVPAPEVKLQNKSVTENGQYTADAGYDGLGQVEVNVPDIPPVLQEKTATQNGAYTPDSGYDGLSKVTVAIPAPDPVVESLEVTENGTYNVPDGIDGYNQVIVDVPDPTKKIILKEQRFDGFVMDDQFGAYTPGYMTPSPFVLNSGETYHVVWDDVEWECTAVQVSNTDVITTVIGNGYTLGLPDTGEPFLIVYNRVANGDGDSSLFFSNEGKDFHTVGIWKESETTIELDFSSGDMSVESDDGKAFSKVNIPTPENLIPENIAGGVNIAGIIGTLVAGGNMVMNAGTFTGTNTAGEITVAHGLGVIPDLFVAFYDSSSTMRGTKAYTSACFIGLSEALQAKLSLSRSAFAAKINSTSAMSIERFDSPLDNINGTRVFSHNATKDYVYVGSSYVYAASGTYMWFAIAGLV